MTRKRPSSRDQKALVVIDANLTTVKEQEDELINSISSDLLVCSKAISSMLSALSAEESTEECWITLINYVASANIDMRSLLKLRKEFD